MQLQSRSVKLATSLTESITSQSQTYHNTNFDYNSRLKGVVKRDLNKNHYQGGWLGMTAWEYNSGFPLSPKTINFHLHSPNAEELVYIYQSILKDNCFWYCGAKQMGAIFIMLRKRNIFGYRWPMRKTRMGFVWNSTLFCSHTELCNIWWTMLGSISIQLWWIPIGRYQAWRSWIPICRYH